MVAKLVVSKWRATLMAPMTFVYNISMPFLFHLFLPGFKGPAFPAILVFYLMFSLSITLEMQNSSAISRLHLPVTTRQVVLGNYLFQVSLVVFAGLLSTVFVMIARKGAFVSGIVPKACAMALLLSGITTGLGNLMPRKGYQIMSMLVFMGLIVLTISGSDASFLPWLSLPVAIGVSLAGFGLALTMSLFFPRRLYRRLACLI